jgi:hypothetical protein
MKIKKKLLKVVKAFPLMIRADFFQIPATFWCPSSQHLLFII